MAFAHLNNDQVNAIIGAFNGWEKEYDSEKRKSLMTDIDYEYVRRLKTTYDNEYDQLRGDLIALNSRQKLENGQVPLEIWLKNAVDVFNPFTEKRIFEQALKAMATPANPDESTEIIVVGLEALIKLIKDDEGAHDSVIIYGNAFKTALREFDVIANYKLLHDGLHKIQLSWPDAGVAEGFLKNDLMRATLSNYSVSLNNTCGELRRTYENGYVDGAENTWIEQLEGYQVNLEKVLNGELPSEPAPAQETIDEAIKCVFNTIKELLTTKLSQLNDRLGKAIDTLHLTELIEAMNSVCEQVTKLSPQSATEQIQQYKTGVIELSRLEGLLRELIEQHNKWQANDTLLRTLGKPLKRTKGEVRSSVQETERLGKLKYIRTIIEETITPLLQGHDTLWSKRLSASSQKFSNEINNGQANQAEQTFDTYREQAWHFFIEIDTEMKDRCEELRVIGNKLRKVNYQLKFNEEWDS